MLGNHVLGTTVQVTNRLQEFGGAVGYLNRTSRWNWGFVGEQTPYVTGGFARGITTDNGGQAFVEQTHRITQINRAASGVVHYPFSRAQRLEFTAGARQISFDQDVETRVFSLITGNEIDRTIEELPRPDSLMLGEAGSIEQLEGIGAGAFEPAGVSETWAAEEGPITVAFDLGGAHHELQPAYLEDWIDPGILVGVNALIAESGRRFELYRAFDQSGRGSATMVESALTVPTAGRAGRAGR
jgi:hypothetical protein